MTKFVIVDVNRAGAAVASRNVVVIIGRFNPKESVAVIVRLVKTVVVDV